MPGHLRRSGKRSHSGSFPSLDLASDGVEDPSCQLLRDPLSNCAARDKDRFRVQLDGHVPSVALKSIWLVDDVDRSRFA